MIPRSSRSPVAPDRSVPALLPLPSWLFAGLIVVLGACSPVSAWAQTVADPPREEGRWAPLDEARRQQPGGNHRLAALDAYLEGNAAWESGHPDQAMAAWQRSGRFDLDFLPPRLRLVQANLLSDFSAAAQSARECLDILQRDFPAQRWLLRHAILGVCLALTLGSLAFLLGLLLRHSRALHHTVMETLSYALRMSRGPATLLAAIV
ncbi:MAG: hypothetical protein KC729_14410, partial [Candidatus Eisenbacteria bacterium]|nr:hypothetical protein [Candidatus Eisenbacteria bacterium]